MTERDDAAARLRELLASPDEANPRLAVRLMGTVGVPDGALAELLVLMQNPAVDPKLRRTARTLFARHAARPARDAVDTVLPRGTTLHTGNAATLNERLDRLGRESGGLLDPERLATLLLPDRGVEYLLATGDEAPARRALEACRTDAALRLPRRGLVTLPAVLGRMTGLTTLDLRGNHLTEVPGPVLELTTLESLDLSANRIAGDGLGAGIDGLVGLRSLNLGMNPLRTFPTAVLRLHGLRVLNLAAHVQTSTTTQDRLGFLELPEEIGRLTHLAELTLRARHLPTLPGALRNLPALRRLSLNRGRVDRLPDWLADLPLRELDLWGLRTIDREHTLRIVARLRDRGTTVRHF